MEGKKTPAQLKAEIEAAHAELNKQIADAADALEATGGRLVGFKRTKQANGLEVIAS